MQIRIDEKYRRAISDLAKENRRAVTHEVNIAIEEHLSRNGRLQAQKKATVKRGR